MKDTVQAWLILFCFVCIRYLNSLRTRITPAVLKTTSWIRLNIFFLNFYARYFFLFYTRFLLRSRLWRYNDAFKALKMCSAAILHKMRNCTYVKSMIQVQKEDEFFRDIKLNIFYKTFFIICKNY